MALSLSEPHPEEPYERAGRQARRRAVRREPTRGRNEACSRWSGWASSRDCPTSSRATRRTTSSASIDQVDVRDGANLVVKGYDFAPSFSIWTTIEECLNPPIVWEKERGWFTLPPFSEPETFTFPEGIGPIDCVHVEHEEVLLIPRWIDCRRVTFKYGLGDEFIEVLKTLHKLGLDATEPVEVRGTKRQSSRRRRCVPAGPCRSRHRDVGQDVRRAPGSPGTGRDGNAARGLPVPRGRQRGDVGARSARKPSCGRRPSTRSLRWSCSPTARGRAPVCSVRRRSSRPCSSTCSTTTALRGGSRSARRPPEPRSADLPSGRAHRSRCFQGHLVGRSPRMSFGLERTGSGDGPEPRLTDLIEPRLAAGGDAGVPRRGPERRPDRVREPPRRGAHRVPAGGAGRQLDRAVDRGGAARISRKDPGSKRCAVTLGTPPIPIEAHVGTIDAPERLLVVTLRDVTELQAGREARFEAEAKYRSLVEHIPAVVYLDPVDEDQNSIYVSPQVRDLIGIEPEVWLQRLLPLAQPRARRRHRTCLGRVPGGLHRPPSAEPRVSDGARGRDGPVGVGAGVPDRRRAGEPRG